MRGTFRVAGRIIDVTCTVEGEPEHPSALVKVETGATSVSVFICQTLLPGINEALQVGRQVQIAGYVTIGAPGELLHVGRELQIVPDAFH